MDKKRAYETLKFLNECDISHNAKILDLGIDNEQSAFLRKFYKNIENTTGQDLDVDFDIVNKYNFITAFEIFEHMFAPFNILNAAKGKLICSVPLCKWFVKAHWNEKDKLDRHYHEFEDRQIFALLERTGWKIISVKYVHEKFKLGIRPIFRLIWPSWMLIYAEKI